MDLEGARGTIIRAPFQAVTGALPRHSAVRQNAAAHARHRAVLCQNRAGNRRRGAFND